MKKKKVYNIPKQDVKMKRRTLTSEPSFILHPFFTYKEVEMALLYRFCSWCEKVVGCIQDDYSSLDCSHCGLRKLRDICPLNSTKELEMTHGICKSCLTRLVREKENEMERQKGLG